MASKLLTVFLLLPVVFARIDVDITASSDESERHVKMFGSTTDVISEEERATFQLDEETLKNAVFTHFGRRPDAAYLRSPTPWGDLYQSYNWAQVARTLTPRKATILSIDSQPSILSTQILNNNSTETEEFKVKITEAVKNTVSSAWEKNGDLKVGRVNNYGFNVKDEEKFRYVSRWGEDASKSKMAGSESEVSITLFPSQSVIAELYATRNTMKIKLDYEASLSGAVAVSYADTFKGHRFWSLDVDAVMRSAGLKNSVASSEMIEFNYYMDSKVVVKDSSSNVMLYSIPLNLY